MNPKERFDDPPPKEYISSLKMVTPDDMTGFPGYHHFAKDQSVEFYKGMIAACRITESFMQDDDPVITRAGVMAMSICAARIIADKIKEN